DRITAETWIDAASATVRTMVRRYDAAGQLLEQTDPDASATMTYDALGRRTSMTTAVPGMPVVRCAYAYDAVGNLLYEAESIDGRAAGVTAYAYDALDRAVRVTQGGDGVAEKRAEIDHDAAGQVTAIRRHADLAGTLEVATSTYRYDGAGRLV